MKPVGGLAQRELYIDRLRAVMIALVILHHTAITYGASGGWYRHEVGVSVRPSSLLLTIFCATNQAYFMGLLFLLAGYFTPASLERKGYARFLGDRFLRLGLPVAAFALTLGPLTHAMLSFAGGGGFWPDFGLLWHQKKFLCGPLWFVLTLLVFNLVYCALRALLGAPRKAPQGAGKRFPHIGWWLLGTLGVALAALSARLLTPLRPVFDPSLAAILAAVHAQDFPCKIIILRNGEQIIVRPLWLAGALLILGLALVPWRRIYASRHDNLFRSKPTQSPVPAWPRWLLGAVCVGAAALAIREALPPNPGPFVYFASYIFLFAVGVIAKPRNWLPQLGWNDARLWVILACIAWPVLPLALIFAGNGGNLDGFQSSLGILRAFWEPFVAWGIIASLLLYFRAHVNQPSRLWEWISRRAYAVYIIHPPVLVGLTLLLHGWAAPALVKFGVVGPLACAATWLIADPLVRLPGVRWVV